MTGEEIDAQREAIHTWEIDVTASQVAFETLFFPHFDKLRDIFEGTVTAEEMSLLKLSLSETARVYQWHSQYGDPEQGLAFIRDWADSQIEYWDWLTTGRQRVPHDAEIPDDIQDWRTQIAPQQPPSPHDC